MELNDGAKKNCAGLTYFCYTDLTKHATAAKYIRSNCHTYLHIKIVLAGTTADIKHKIIPYIMFSETKFNHSMKKAFHISGK